MKQKQYVVISCPIDTFSGYGARARDFVKATIEAKKDEWDVWVMAQRWGNTPWGYLDDHSEEWGWMKKHLLFNNQMTQKPDVWMQITIPSEFQPIGNYNIGVTAGIETTICAPDWIDGVNRMDVTFVSSNHSKKVFETSQFEEKNNQGQTVRQIKLQKPVEVLFEGADIERYKPIESKEIKNIDLSSIKEDFCYLFVGHWLQGDVGEDRKNVGLLVKAFYETFKNKNKKPALILKTSSASTSYMDREEILKKINMIKETVNSNNLPNVYLFHGDLSEEELNELYNHPKVKAMVNLTKGEGFGRPLLEFSLVKKPIITTNWSGHTDFLNSEFCCMIDGDLTKVHDSAANQWLIKESSWFSPHHNQIGHYLINVFENYKNYSDGAKRQAYKSKTEFSWDKMKEKTNELLTKYIPEFPTMVQLKLPQLKKIELPKLKTTNG